MDDRPKQENANERKLLKKHGSIHLAVRLGHRPAETWELCADGASRSDDCVPVEDADRIVGCDLDKQVVFFSEQRDRRTRRKPQRVVQDDNRFAVFDVQRGAARIRTVHWALFLSHGFFTLEVVADQIYSTSTTYFGFALLRTRCRPKPKRPTPISDQMARLAGSGTAEVDESVSDVSCALMVLPASPKTATAKLNAERSGIGPNVKSSSAVPELSTSIRFSSM